MTERSCGRFDRERWRRIKTERHGRLGFHVPQNRQHARGFAGFDFSYNHRFIRQDRARESGQASRVDMLPKQLDENPASDRTRQRERSEQQSQPGWPVIGQHSAFPEDKCAKGKTKNRNGGRSADRRNPMFLDPLSAFGRSVDRGGAAKPSAMELLQYRPPGFHALENADDQNVIALLPPKSHIQPYKI